MRVILTGFIHLVDSQPFEKMDFSNRPIPPPDHTFLEATWRLFAPDDPGRNPKGALAKIGPVIIHGNQQGLVARLPTTLWDSDHLPDGT